MPLERDGRTVCKSASAYLVLEVTDKGYLVEHSCEYGHYSRLELPEEVCLGPRPRVGEEVAVNLRPPPLHATIRHLVVVSDKEGGVRNL